MMTEHKKISTALAAAQISMGKALKDSTNPHFKRNYADLSSVMDACMAALNSNGIAVIQPLVSTELGHTVVTKFLHGSDETLECSIPLILGKNDMQGLGSAITYARRYGLMSLAGIAPEEDDGNAAVKSAPKNPPKSNTTSRGLRDTFMDAVKDKLPEGATQAQIAAGYARAMVEEFQSKTGLSALTNAWDRHEKYIKIFEDRYPDLREMVGDAHSTRKMEITGTAAPKNGAQLDDSIPY